jgi:hypothetical protein
LRSSWERSSIRFTGWGSCEALSWSQRAETVGLYIHWDAPNNAFVGGKGRTTKDSPTVQFKPWGNDRQCISWNWGKATYEVRFSCVEQYAIHEFGHIIGFEHEWRHPERPGSCTNREASEYVLSQYQLSDTERYGTFFVPNRNDYDWKSIMTYDTGCAYVEGERFGSPNLSPTDLNALLTVYSPNTLNTLWDLSWYLWTQPDVAAAYGANGAEHFLRFGIGEGRMASTALDLRDYLNRYPDLRQAFGTDTALALNHWVQNGVREGRQGSVFFNPAYYLSIYPDLIAAFGANNYTAAHFHWVTWGINEGRRGSAEFDAGYYLRANPDVAAAYGSSNFKGAMLHWLRHGRSEGRRGAQ